MSSARTILTALTALAALSLSACGGEAEPSTAGGTPTPTQTTPTDEGTPTPTEEAGAVVKITIEGDTARPLAEQVDLERGETLTLRITSDRAGELHVHSTPEQVVDFEDGTVTRRLTLEQPGTVDIEEHDTGVILVRALVS